MNQGHEAGGSTGVPWRLVGVLTVAVAVVVAAGWVVLRGDSGPLERAAAVVDDRGRWTTGSDAAEALGALADALVDEADGCDPSGDRCADLHAAIGWAQVSALTTLRCTQPFVVEVRAHAGDLVALLRSGEPVDDPPPVVKC